MDNTLDKYVNISVAGEKILITFSMTADQTQSTVV